MWHSFIFQDHLECALDDLVPNVELRDACSDMLDYTNSFVSENAAVCHGR